VVVVTSVRSRRSKPCFRFAQTACWGRCPQTPLNVLCSFKVFFRANKLAVPGTPMNNVASIMKKHDPQYQPDSFITYLTDLPWKDQRETMERPFFSLSKGKRIKPIEYTSPDGKIFVKVTSNPEYGIATIWDADILIWAASQIIRLVEAGHTNIPRTLRFFPYDLLKGLGRDPRGKRGYELLRATLNRLRATTVQTNIRSNGLKKANTFGWLDSWQEITDEYTGQSKGMALTIPDWFYQGVLMRGGVLSIHPNYFELTGGFERLLYRVARKHAGMQEQGFYISVPTLFEKSGSDGIYRRFKHEIRKVVERDNIPEYHLAWIGETASDEPSVHMVRRSKLDPTDPSFRWEGKRDRRAPKECT